MYLVGQEAPGRFEPLSRTSRFGTSPRSTGMSIALHSSPHGNRVHSGMWKCRPTKKGLFFFPKQNEPRAPNAHMSPFLGVLLPIVDMPHSHLHSHCSHFLLEKHALFSPPRRLKTYPHTSAVPSIPLSQHYKGRDAPHHHPLPWVSFIH